MQFNDVNFTLGPISLFEKLNFSFPMGMIIGLIGMNGSGKSTLLKMMSGFCEPNSGNITFQNTNLYANRILQSQIGYVPSHPMLFPFLTVYENMLWISELRNVSPKKINNLIRQFELTGYQKILFGKLSDGLKKRVDIASAFLHQPNLLILDEPCAGLDPTQRQHIWNNLAAYRSVSRLIIISSHHPDELTTFCDKIYLLSQGTLVNYPFSPSFAQTLWGTLKTTPLSREETVI